MRGRRALLAAAVALAAAPAGCARTELRTPQGRATALVAYAPRACLAVAPLLSPGADGATHEARVLLLPDHRRPVHIRPRPGLGSCAASLRLERGMVAGLEIALSGRGAETASALASAATQAREAAQAAGWSPSLSALYDIVPLPDGSVALVPTPLPPTATVPPEARHPVP